MEVHVLLHLNPALGSRRGRLAQDAPAVLEEDEGQASGQRMHAAEAAAPGMCLVGLSGRPW